MSGDSLGLIERDELIERLIEADEALFEDGGAISHRDSAEAAVRVVEDYIDQRLRGAVADRDALSVMLKRLLDVALVDGYGETVRDEAEALLDRERGQ